MRLELFREAYVKYILNECWTNVSSSRWKPYKFVDKISLKRHNQAKIIEKSVFLFWLLNITVWCKHVHRLELQKFFLTFVLRIYQLSEI